MTMGFNQAALKIQAVFRKYLTRKIWNVALSNFNAIAELCCSDIRNLSSSYDYDIYQGGMIR
jgi:hypothetical protein